MNKDNICLILEHLWKAYIEGFRRWYIGFGTHTMCSNFLKTVEKKTLFIKISDLKIFIAIVSEDCKTYNLRISLFFS